MGVTPLFRADAPSRGARHRSPRRPGPLHLGGEEAERDSLVAQWRPLPGRFYQPSARTKSNTTPEKPWLDQRIACLGPGVNRPGILLRQSIRRQEARASPHEEVRQRLGARAQALWARGVVSFAATGSGPSWGADGLQSPGLAVRMRPRPLTLPGNGLSDPSGPTPSGPSGATATAGNGQAPALWKACPQQSPADTPDWKSNCLEWVG